MEALVRWQHPSLGLLVPSKFLPIAEETGLIVSLDQWVMKTAMRQMAQWHEKGLNPGILALNLSIKHFIKKILFPYLRVCYLKQDVTQDVLN